MSDYNFLLETRLSPPQLQTLNHISRVATGMRLNLYLAGGAVRDLTLGQGPIRNLNLVTEGDVQKLFRALHGGKDRRPSKERTHSAETQASLPILYAHFDPRREEAVFSFVNGVEAGITLARRENYSKPGRPAEIIPAGIFDDLRQRDFAANAMAISLHPNSRGLLLDPTNGAADIESRELRALSSRTFFEDPSRIYRVLRLTLRLGFKVSERTQAWLESALQSKAWEHMTPQQQGRELRATLQEESPARVLRAFAGRGVLVGLDRSLAKIHLDRFEKVRPVVRSVPEYNPFALNFVALSEKLSPAHKKRLAQKVIPDPATVKLVMSLDSEARKLVRALAGAKATKPSFVYQLLRTKPQDLLYYVLVHYPQAGIQKHVKNFLFKFPQIRAKLPVAELQALGVEAGPRFEKILDQLFIALLDGKLKSPQQITKALYQLAGAGPSGTIRAPANDRNQESGQPSKTKRKQRRA